MNTPTRSRRRWFRFSLRTLFVVVTLVAIWLGWSLNWIRQRREFLNTIVADATEMMSDTGGRPAAPRLLWLFGERGVGGLFIRSRDKEVQAQGRRLFPEARQVTAISD